MGGNGVSHLIVNDDMEAVHKIVGKLMRNPAARPDMGERGVEDFYRALIEDCWAVEPELRPTFDVVLERFDAAAVDFAPRDGEETEIGDVEAIRRDVADVLALLTPPPPPPV